MAKTKQNFAIGKRIVDQHDDVRIATGVRQTTIPAPGDQKMRKLSQKVMDTTPWGGQFSNFQQLRTILARNGLAFKTIGIYVNEKGTPAYTARDRSKNVTLITYLLVCPGHMVWYKYEGYTAGGGQNHVFVANRKIKLTAFLEFSDDEQDRLLMGKAPIASEAVKELMRKRNMQTYSAEDEGYKV